MFRVHDRFFVGLCVFLQLDLFLSVEESLSKFLFELQVWCSKKTKCKENDYGEKVNIK